MGLTAEKWRAGGASPANRTPLCAGFAPQGVQHRHRPFQAETSPYSVRPSARPRQRPGPRAPPRSKARRGARADISLELAKLPSVPPKGSVTAGIRLQMSDGAGAVMLVSEGAEGVRPERRSLTFRRLCGRGSPGSPASARSPRVLLDRRQGGRPRLDQAQRETRITAHQALSGDHELGLNRKDQPARQRHRPQPPLSATGAITLPHACCMACRRRRQPPDMISVCIFQHERRRRTGRLAENQQENSSRVITAP